jgi:hypothetical protein
MREYRKNKSEMDSVRARAAEMRMMIESLEAANQSLEEMNRSVQIVYHYDALL